MDDVRNSSLWHKSTVFMFNFLLLIVYIRQCHCNYFAIYTYIVYILYIYIYIVYI